MWFITFDSNKSKAELVKSVFRNRLDAFKYIHLNLNNANCYSNVSVKNGEVNLVSEKIKTGAALQVIDAENTIDYGVIDEITNYLIIVKKLDNSVVELTKNRVNKEVLLGNFKVFPSGVAAEN